MTFGHFARHKRTVSGKSVLECAQALGISEDAIHKKERGERQWTLESDVVNLATLYNLTPSQLLAEWEQWAKA